MAESTQLPVAVVVGVGPGLGAALVRRFAEGYVVALLARGEEYLATLAQEIASAGGHALAVPTDVRRAEQNGAAFDTIRPQIGVPEGLLYNTAMRPVGRLMETQTSTVENTQDAHGFGGFLCTQQVAPDL